MQICKKVLYLTYYFTSEGKYNLYFVLFTDVILSMVMQNYTNMYTLMVSSKYKDLIAGLVIGF